MRIRTPWIYSPTFDLVAIIGPALVATSVVMIWGHSLAGIEETPVWLWIFLVLGIDVAHVYSSLYRTYFDREEFNKRRTLYLVAPAVSWLGGIAIYAVFGPTLFWSCVAYFAIYHFVRQQYGFMMLYRRGEPARGWSYRLDQVAIYLATLYPMLYWHTYPRSFQWFSNFEVVRIPVTWPEQMLRWIYPATLAIFVLKEIQAARQKGEYNIGKTLLLFTTAVSWATGIILFNGDLTFTIINIVAHGVPYLALVWIYQYRKMRAQSQSPKRSGFFQAKYIPLYILSLSALAFFEEGLWDRFVWKEQVSLFGSSTASLSPLALTVLVPLLTMPQVTHYVLDAFIWRVNKRGGQEVRAVIG